MTIEVYPDDPVAYVLSLNLHRRQLTPSQLAMVGARARAIYDRQARERMAERKGDQPGARVANLPPLAEGKARDAAGKAVGVGGKSIDHATKVLRRRWRRGGPLGTAKASYQTDKIDGQPEEVK